MTSELDVDRVLEDWFAQGPSRLPDRVISETVEHLDHIKRRRYLLPPGRERMTRLLIAGTGLAAALVAAVVGFATITGGDGVGGPDGVTYTSDRHGYSVFLPDGWTVEERPGTWERRRVLRREQRRRGRLLRGASTPMGSRPCTCIWQASRSRRACRSTTGSPAMTWPRRPNSRASSSSGPTRAASSTARPLAVGTYHCEDFENGIPYTGVQTMVAHNGRGYAIYVWPAPLPGFRPPGWEDMPVPELQAAAARWLDAVEFTD